MSEHIRISHPELLLFSSWSGPGQTEESSGRILSWKSEEMDTPTLISCIGSFESPRSFNAIHLGVHEDFPEFFPGTFRFEISMDGRVWEPILQESDFRAGRSSRGTWNFPLITTRHLKFLFLADETNAANKYFSAFGEFKVMISGLVELNVSSELDRLWVRENLIDERAEYGWSSGLSAERREEYMLMDLGSVNRVTELRLLSKNDRETFFPEVFQIAYSEDNIAWHHLLEENGFLAEPGTWYRWRFVATNMRYVRISITEGARTREGKYISQIIEIELYGASDLMESTGPRNAEPIPYASVLRSGIVRMSMDGEVREGIVVQANDRRLRDATTEYRGIVELAADGEDRDGVVVQGDDRRLKYASEDLPGIVRMARDGEVRALHAVQANDRRLNLATEEAPGLVELAADGEDRAGIAVQGNDARLKPSTEKAHGIARLAPDGSDKPGVVVQGNDARLKAATVERAGIMRFARGGEASGEAAVQGDDPRLRPATEEASGIVELARDGENKAGVVVQGNDARLKIASEKAPGIVELAPPGSQMEGKAVQAHDPRMTDAREPKPHAHDYADREHDFDSHTGYIQVEGELSSVYQSIAPPPVNHGPITGINTGGGAGLVGRGKVDGAAGAGESAGVVGYGLKNGLGVLGAAREGAGGVFVSERNYGLVVGRDESDRALAASGLGLFVEGDSRLNGSLYLPGEKEKVAPVLAAGFEIDEGDVLAAGDIVVTTKKVGLLQRSREYGSRNVVGVIVDRAALIVNSADEIPMEPVPQKKGAASRKRRLVALSGVVPVRVHAGKQGVKPGDLLVTSLQSGRAEKLDEGKYKPGMIFARALGSLDKGEGLVSAVLSCG